MQSLYPNPWVIRILFASTAQRFPAQNALPAAKGHQPVPYQEYSQAVMLLSIVNLHVDDSVIVSIKEERMPLESQ